MTQATMRTKNKSIEVEASHQGSRPRKTALAKPMKSKSSVTTSSSKKRKPAKRFSGPMGSGVFGLHVGGKRLKYDLEIYKNKNKLVKLFGKPIADLLAGERRVSYERLSTPYWNKTPKDDKEADQIARAFILCLIGSSFLNGKSQYVTMHYAPSLEIVSDIGNYDWGSAALACLYRSMDSCSMGRSSSMGRYWRAWEVNWNLWGTNESEMLEEVKNTVAATQPRVPKIPPRIMLSDYKLIDESEVEEVLNGYPASEWLANSSDYAQYRDEYIRYRHYEDLRKATKNEHDRCYIVIEIVKNTTGTTIASSGIGQDVLADDAEHEYRTKFRHDIVRKGKTKILVPEEHEEDEEEEEEEEDEEEEEEEDEEKDGEEQEEEQEDEEENEDEAWVEEKEDEDEDGAAAKGNPDAEQHSTNQKHKGDNSVHSRTPKEKENHVNYGYD
ncbi:hypothetical protein ACE6H2_023814 [Prunus campanulata]